MTMRQSIASLFLITAAFFVSYTPRVSAQTTLPNPTWVGSWSVAPQQAGILDPQFDNLSQQTLRQTIHASIGGSAFRVEISNVFGQSPLTISDVHVAGAQLNSDASPSSSTIPNTDHLLKFSGSTVATIPAGQSILSDGVVVNLPANANLTISIYFPKGVNSASNPTYHQDGGENGMFLADGDVSAETNISPYSTFSSYYFLDALHVVNAEATGSLVALGASITDGDKSGFNTNIRWTNLLAKRLLAGNLQVGVLNKGISGNGLLSGGAGNPAAVDRFTRDVVNQPDVKWVIFSDDAINSLGGTGELPSYTDLIGGMKQMITQAHAHNIKFYCSTLTPNGGRSPSDWTPEAETTREEINAFIRAPGSGCDGVVDQDVATHDPKNPLQYRPAFDSGDHLHPNAEGHVAIANSVDLGLFTSSGVPPFSPPSNACSILLPNEGMIPDHPIFSCDHRFELYLQDDGNLILYFNNSILWTSRSEGHMPSVATLLADGNFAIFDKSGKILWQTDTAGLLGGSLFVQNDGNLVIYVGTSAKGNPVWASNTCCH